MKIEAVVLTGGASRRMGRDKATVPVGGVPQAERIVRSFLDLEIPVTVLGREPIGEAAFLADAEEFAGPLAALSRFRPSAEGIFAVSCDMPLFDAAVVRDLRDLIGDAEAAVPVVDGWRQPLCALYRAAAWSKIPEVISRGGRSLMGWLDRLTVREVELSELAVAPTALASANTEEELRALVSEEAR